VDGFDAAVGGSQGGVEGWKVVHSPAAATCAPQANAVAMKRITLPFLAKVEISVDLLEMRGGGGRVRTGRHCWRGGGGRGKSPLF